MKYIKPGFFLFILLIASQTTLWGQEGDAAEEFIVSYHSKGDQTFSIDAGLFIPLTYTDLSNGTGTTGFAGHMNLGGSGFLSYCGYLDGNFRIGGEFGGMFASGINSKMFYMVPIMVKTAYDININTYFTVPLYLSAGITLNSYQDKFSPDPIVVPAVGFNWNYDSEWSFTVKYSLWMIPELAVDTNQSGLGIFSDVRIGVEYNF